MLLAPQKRRIITLIVEGLGGHKGPRAPYVQKMGEESGTGEFVVPNDSDFALTQCMQKFAGCLERKDFGGMGTALKEALDICCSSDEDM